MPKKALTVSIVIPVYNEEDYLEACLESINKQTIEPLEIIIVDNQSTDNSIKIAKKFNAKVVKESTKGVLYARNKGFNMAKGDIIGRIDADTHLEPNWVATVQQIFLNENIAGITGPTGYYDMIFPRKNINVDIFFRSRVFQHFSKFPALLGSNMAIRSSAWKSVKSEACKRRDIFEDSDLAIHLQKNGHEVSYQQALRAYVSARRLDDSFIDFYRYISLYKNTYRYHGFNGLMPQTAIAIYMTFYVLMWPFRRAYDPKIKKRNIFHILHKNIPRKHPMEK